MSLAGAAQTAGAPTTEPSTLQGAAEQTLPTAFGGPTSGLSHPLALAVFEHRRGKSMTFWAFCSVAVEAPVATGETEGTAASRGAGH